MNKILSIKNYNNLIFLKNSNFFTFFSSNSQLFTFKCITPKPKHFIFASVYPHSSYILYHLPQTSADFFINNISSFFNYTFLLRSIASSVYSINSFSFASFCTSYASFTQPVGPEPYDNSLAFQIFTRNASDLIPPNSTLYFLENIFDYKPQEWLKFIISDVSSLHSLASPAFSSSTPLLHFYTSFSSSSSSFLLWRYERYLNFFSPSDFVDLLTIPSLKFNTNEKENTEKKDNEFLISKNSFTSNISLNKYSADHIHSSFYEQQKYLNFDYLNILENNSSFYSCLLYENIYTIVIPYLIEKMEKNKNYFSIKQINKIAKICSKIKIRVLSERDLLAKFFYLLMKSALSQVVALQKKKCKKYEENKNNLNECLTNGIKYFSKKNEFPNEKKDLSLQAGLLAKKYENSKDVSNSSFSSTSLNPTKSLKNFGSFNGLPVFNDYKPLSLKTDLPNAWNVASLTFSNTFNSLLLPFKDVQFERKEKSEQNFYFHENMVMNLMSGCTKLHLNLVNEIDHLLNYFSFSIINSSSLSNIARIMQIMSKNNLERKPLFYHILYRISDLKTFESLIEKERKINTVFVSLGEICMSLIYKNNLYYLKHKKQKNFKSIFSYTLLNTSPKKQIIYFIQMKESTLFNILILLSLKLKRYVPNLNLNDISSFSSAVANLKSSFLLSGYEGNKNKKNKEENYNKIDQIDYFLEEVNKLNSHLIRQLQIFDLAIRLEYPFLAWKIQSFYYDDALRNSETCSSSHLEKNLLVKNCIETNNNNGNENKDNNNITNTTNISNNFNEKKNVFRINENLNLTGIKNSSIYFYPICHLLRKIRFIKPSDFSPLHKLTSEQHEDVSDILNFLQYSHFSEVTSYPYVFDILFKNFPVAIEIDGPMHFLKKLSFTQREEISAKGLEKKKEIKFCELKNRKENELMHRDEIKQCEKEGNKITITHKKVAYAKTQIGTSDGGAAAERELTHNEITPRTYKFSFLKDENEKRKNGENYEYNQNTILKHRLLYKLGYKIIHISYFDWPQNKFNKQIFIQKIIDNISLYAENEIKFYKRKIK